MSTKYLEHTTINPELIHELSVPFVTLTEKQPKTKNAQKQKKPRRACSNCRAAHVACSHTQPCARCIDKGIEDSCIYLARKRRTNFAKQKEEREAQKKRAVEEENFVLHEAQAFNSVFGEEYPFPFMPNPPTTEEDYLISMLQDPYFPEPASTTSPPSETPNISLSSALLPFRPASPISQYGTPDLYFPSMENEAMNVQTSTYEANRSLDYVRQENTTLLLLQQLKEKNDRLERLLQSALKDVQELKERDSKHWVMTSFTEEIQISPGPAICVVHCIKGKPWFISKCNDVFKRKLHYTNEDLQKGIPPKSIFTEASGSVLCREVCGARKDRRERLQFDLNMVTKYGVEIGKVHCVFHIAYNEEGEIVYKVLYAHFDKS